MHYWREAMDTLLSILAAYAIILCIVCYFRCALDRASLWDNDDSRLHTAGLLFPPLGVVIGVMSFYRFFKAGK
jgi:H+/Cl- antiporter ClcA